MNVAKMLREIHGGVVDLKTQQKEIKSSLGRHGQRLKTLEDKMKSRRAVSLPGVDEEKNKFSFRRAIIAIARRDPSLAPFEMDVMKEASKRRDLSTTVDSAGGFIVPVEIVSELIELLRSKTVVLESGATQMTGLTGSPVKIPKQTGGSTGFWVGENQVITSSQVALGEVELSPHEAAALTKMSNRLLTLSSPSAEAIVRDDMMKVLARLLDLAALRGTGTLNQPLGIVNTAGINTVTSIGTPTVDDLYDMLFELEQDNADLGTIGFVFHPRTWNSLRKEKDSEGRYILMTDRQDPLKGTLIGLPFRQTTQIPITLSGNESEIFLANWADLLWGMWGGMEILASQETSDAFEKNQTWVRIITEVDFAVRHEESFVLGTGVTV